jgi:hypothetical protein
MLILAQEGRYKLRGTSRGEEKAFDLHRPNAGAL